MSKAKRVVTKFNFDKLMKSGNKAHVALVDSAANQQEVLVMKAKAPEVRIEVTMKEFLKKFFDLWEEDSACLAGILGYDSGMYDDHKDDDGSYKSEEDFLQEKINKVSLLKGRDIPDTLSEKMVEAIKSLQTTVGDKLETPSDEGEVIQTEKSSTEGEKSMNEEEIKAMQDEIVELKKAKEEAATLKQELDTLKAAKAKKAEDDMVELVKGFNFISEDDQPEMVEALLKSSNAGIFMATLEKARKALEAAVTVEEGHDEETTQVTDTEKANDMVTQLLKARNSK